MRALGIGLGLALAACAATDSREDLGASQAALVSGEPSADLAVVALERDGRIVCSGALIRADLVLTAGHCVTTVPDAIVVGDPERPAERIAVRAARAHPEFDAATFASDVAVIELAHASAIAPLAVYEHPLRAGDDVTLVGWGATGPFDTTRVRRRGTAEVGAVAETSFALVPSPSRPCGGDSGGPVLKDGAIAGVVSSGDSMCRVFANAARVDLAFLRDVEAPPPDGAASCTVARSTPAGEKAPWIGGAIAAMGFSRRRLRRRPHRRAGHRTTR